MGTGKYTDKTKTVSGRGQASTQTRLRQSVGGDRQVHRQDYDSQRAGTGKYTDKTKTVSGWGQASTQTRLRQSVGGDRQD